MTLAIIFNHNFSERVDIRISPGDEIKVMNADIQFESIDIVAEQNFDSVKANFVVNENFTLTPEKRIYKVGGQITSETAVNSNIVKDYLIVLGDRFEDGSWSAAFSIKYGIFIIWLSAALLLVSMLYGTIRRA